MLKRKEKMITRHCPYKNCPLQCMTKQSHLRIFAQLLARICSQIGEIEKDWLFSISNCNAKTSKHAGYRNERNGCKRKYQTKSGSKHRWFEILALIRIYTKRKKKHTPYYCTVCVYLNKKKSLVLFFIYKNVRIFSIE